LLEKGFGLFFAKKCQKQTLRNRSEGLKTLALSGGERKAIA